MRKFLNQLQKFRKDEDGAALVEYAVLLGVLLAVSLITMGLMGTDINNIFVAIEAKLAAAAAAAA